MDLDSRQDPRPGPPAANAPDQAIALRYAPETGRAPFVVAAGRGAMARRLLELAEEHGVPVREDKDLAALLALVALGDEIPLELYQAVAEVIAFVHRVNGRLDPEGDTASRPAARA